MIMGMDWLYLQGTKVDKAIECLDDNREQRILWGKKKPTLVIMVTAMQANHSWRKGCVLFEVNIFNDKGKDVKDAKLMKNYSILKQFQDVFPLEISNFPPHKEVDFSI